VLLSSSGLIWCSLTRSFQLTSEMFSRFIAGSDSFVPMDTETLSEWVNSLCAPIISLAGLVASALEGQTDVRDPAKNHVSAPSTDLEHDLSMAKPLQVSEPLTSTAKRRTRASDIMMIMQVSAAMHTRTEGKAADMSKAQMKIASLKSLPPISLTGEPKAAATHKSRLSTHLRTKSLHVEAKSKRQLGKQPVDHKDDPSKLSGRRSQSPHRNAHHGQHHHGQHHHGHHHHGHHRTSVPQRDVDLSYVRPDYVPTFCTSCHVSLEACC
jgi:hypothetical protein